jgi:AAA15 family ATPase/GTPase
MIKTLQLNNFRGIESVEFNDLGRVNLIVGGNNAGKTSVLESLVLLFGNQSQLIGLPSTFRQNMKQDNWNTFWSLLGKKGAFDSFLVSSDIAKVQVSFNGRQETGLYRTTPEASLDPRYPLIHFPNNGSNGHIDGSRSKEELQISVLSTAQPDPVETSKLFNEIAPLNPENETKLENLLQKSIEPRIRRLRYAKPKGAQEHLVYVDLGDGPMVPFTQMGQAFCRALHIYCEIFALQPDILLVDEIENGLYYGGLEDFWKGLIAVLEDQNVQLFATTHSRECMEAACQACPEDVNLRYLRLDRKIDNLETIVGTTFDQKTMALALEAGQEMR